MKTLLIIPWPNDPIPGLPEGVDCKALNDGVPLRGYVDVARNEHLFLDAVVQAEKDGYGAVVSLCFADTGIENARKMVNIPVLGCTRVGMHLACILGHKVCVLQPDYELNANTTRNIIDIYNMGSFAKLVNPHVDSLTIFNDVQQAAASGKAGDAIQKCVDAIIRSLEEDGTDVVVFGSGALAGAEDILRAELSNRRYEVPVANGLPAASGFAQVLDGLQLSQSRTGYAWGA